MNTGPCLEDPRNPLIALTKSPSHATVPNTAYPSCGEDATGNITLHLPSNDLVTHSPEATGTFPHRTPPAIDSPTDRLVCFDPRGYQIRIASGNPDLEMQAAELVNTLYGARGLRLAGGIRGVRDTHRTTLAACDGDQVIGTLTLGVDSASGLLADELYADQLNTMRSSGRRLCEVTALAVSQERSDTRLLARLFNIAYLLAHPIHGMTDLVAEVHPRHAGFYRKLMNYRIAGPVRTCPRVRAPAVLMHLCLQQAKTQIQRHAGQVNANERSLYRHFIAPHAQHELLCRLRPKSC